MQACPYDSIYIDPDEGTAAKCHFCAHRTEVGLEPSCVVVCPEHAIIAGDLDACEGEIAQLLAREPVRVRKPEQGTRPKLYYIDGDESAIVPTAARHESIYMWSQRNESMHGGGALYPPDSPLLQKDALAAYDVSHARPWGWQVPAYCWTKAIGSGALAIPAIAMLMGRLGADRLRDMVLSTHCVTVHGFNHCAAGLGSGTQGTFSTGYFHAAEQVVAGAGSIHSDRLQRARWFVLARFGVRAVRDCIILIVAHGPSRVSGCGIHRFSFWTMRGARFVADAFAAGAFDRAGFDVRGGCAALAAVRSWRVAATSGGLLRRRSVLPSFCIC